MILYSGPLYSRLSESLRIFERKNPYRESAIDTVKEAAPVDVILMGLGSYGSGLAEYLLRRDKTLLGVDFNPAALDRWRERGMAVLYGDMEDPELMEQLPLSAARWVISSIRSREVNLALLEHLKHKKFGGRIALTATSKAEADEFASAGAHLVFEPYADATEQAADALTYALDFLPETINWPVSFLEERIRSDASAAGRTIRDIPLRSMTGVSILAVSRGGRVIYDPEPDFRIFPGDRLLLMGPPGGLKEAKRALNQFDARHAKDDNDRFEIAEIRIADKSPLAEQSLAEARFRQTYGVTLLGIRRGQEQITTIAPTERLRGGDCLIVIGASETVKALKGKEPI